MSSLSNQPDSHLELAERSEARQRRRLVRRWKRRAMAFAPLLGIPLIFGALALSMDLVSYLPEAEAAKSQGRSVRTRPLASTDRAPARFARSAASTSASPGSSHSKQEGLKDLIPLDPVSISLELSDSRNDAKRVPVTAFSESRKR